MKKQRKKKFILAYINFLVQILGNGRSQLSDTKIDHQKQRQTRVVFMFHHIDFLADQVCAHSDTKSVWSSDTSLLVEECEPFLRQETHTDFAWLSTNLLKNKRDFYTHWKCSYEGFTYRSGYTAGCRISCRCTVCRGSSSCPCKRD